MRAIKSRLCKCIIFRIELRVINANKLLKYSLVSHSIYPYFLSLSFSSHSLSLGRALFDLMLAAVWFAAQINCAVLKNAFDAFDQEKKGFIEATMIGTILSMLGHQLDDKMLADIIAEVDDDGSGQIEFTEFCTLAARFLVEEDAEAMQQELKEAFRLYDKEGNSILDFFVSVPEIEFFSSFFMQETVTSQRPFCEKSSKNWTIKSQTTIWT